jgi:transposase
MNITTVGIDLAKNVLQIHGANERGKKVFNKQLRRKQVLVYFAQLPPCLIGLEACGSAIRTPCTSRFRKELDRHVKELETQIQVWHGQNDASRKLAHIPGIGPITASALVASIGDASSFKSGRQLAAWLGLVPRQHSSGGKQMLQGISKRGDAYLRTLLIHGARSVIRVSAGKTNQTNSWLINLLERRHKNVAAVALANKNARIVWALLTHQREYQSDFVLVM